MGEPGFTSEYKLLGIQFVDDPVQKQKDNEECKARCQECANDIHECLGCLQKPVCSLCHVVEFFVLVMILTGMAMVVHSSLQVVNGCRQPCEWPQPNYHPYFFQEQCHYECFQTHNVDVWKYSISTGLLVATIQLIIRFVWYVFNNDRQREYRCVNCRPNNDLCRKVSMWFSWLATIGFMIGLVYFTVFDVCSGDLCFERIPGSKRAGNLVVTFVTLLGSAEVVWFMSWISMV